MNTDRSYRESVEEFKKFMSDCTSVLVVTHDYPDPDSIASAFGISTLLKRWNIDSQIAFGGFVGRAENRALIRFAKIKTIPVVLADFDEYDKVILVDSVPQTGHISLPEGVKVSAVFDHHRNMYVPSKNTFCDIRVGMGATSTIITKYLRVAGCEVNKNLATALFYGIKTDTKDMARSTTEDDIDCYKFLFDKTDYSILSKIENPERDPEYFRVLSRASADMKIYSGTVGHTDINLVSSPDLVAEIADLYHSYENLEWMFCTAHFNNQLFFSVRSKTDESAHKIARELAESLGGSGGGHTNMAAGRVPLADNNYAETLEGFKLKITQLFKIENVADYVLK